MTKKILIVEDENIVALGIKKILRSTGYLVPGIASTGPDAIDRAAKTYPDLVLMDITLKGDMNGIETADEITRRWNIPVIFVTAYSDMHILESGELKTPAGYIRKPFTEKELLDAIENVIGPAEPPCLE